MLNKVAIVGVGTTGFRATSPDVSFRELTYEAAVKAYTDARVDPKDIDGFVATSEDFLEGYSIADEYSNDQLGAIHKPVSTVAGDFMQSLAQGCMMIQSGFSRIVAVQALSKASNMLTQSDLVNFALDPVYNRPLDVHGDFIAGLEMNRYMYETGTTRESCARVVVKNRRNALTNPLAGHGARVTVEDVLRAEVVSHPLTELDIAPTSDGAVVIVLASKDVAPSLSDLPLWIRGMGWCSDSPTLESRDWGTAVYCQMAADMAYKRAGITSPRSEIDFAEISDEYSYKELQHLEALRLFGPGEAGFLTESGATEIKGEFPVNASGGSLGAGRLYEATGAQKVLEVVLQLRGEKGTNQIEDVHVGLAQTWRGVPTTTGAVAILSNE
ncbi:MAG: acetyl-CoA acetyltransferase [Thermodesulfobacteriota bacterium]|nr:acetyl-CoA acetyltransferase [Thermodesulfobacteriota bacterium]